MSVTSINPDIDVFNKLNGLLKKHQCLPLLHATLEYGLKAKADLTKISENLSEIFYCNDDQFWGCKINSIYFKENSSDLSDERIGFFRREYPSFFSAIDQFTQILDEYKWDYIENLNCLSEQDFNTLERKNKKESEELIVPYKMREGPRQVEERVADAIIDYGQTRQKKIEDANQFISQSEQETEYKRLPFVRLLTETSFEFKYNDDLKSLSEYLDQHFSRELKVGNRIISEREFPETTRISGENKKEILKIISSVLFMRLIKNESKETRSYSIDRILKDRLSGTYKIQISKESDSYSIYLALLSNFTVLSGLLDVSCLDNNILDEDELFGAELKSFSTSNDLFGYHILFLPNRLKQVCLKFLMCEDWGTDILDPEFLAEISFGLPKSNINKGLERWLEKTFNSINCSQEKVSKIQEMVLGNLSNWFIPLYFLETLDSFVEEHLFDNRKIEEQVAFALNRTLKEARNPDLKLPAEWGYAGSNALSEVFMEEYYWDTHSHPALHSILFASSPIVFEARRWIDFSNALLKHNQPHYACLIMGLFFETRTVIEFALEPDRFSNEPALYLEAWMFDKILSKLQSVKSFSIVADSIDEYLKSSEHSSLHFGFLANYRSQGSDYSIDDKGQLFIPGLTIHHSKESFTVDLSFLAPASKTNFEKCLKILGKENFVAVFGSDLPNWAGKGLEAEFKSRTRNLVGSDIKEFEMINVRIKPNSQNTTYFTLGNFWTILKNINRLSNHNKMKMPSIFGISKHEKFNNFLSDMNFIMKLRNSSTHVTNFRQIDDVQKIIEDSEKLRPKIDFCLEVLRETRSQT
ncbi:hypothetical protein OA871_00185 [Paracoccaceae bacterium]|nr:hypothetical protein [Paracoccaceae bacterium]